MNRLLRPNSDDSAADGGPQWCDGCGRRMCHGHFAYSHCCKGCCNRSICDSDCPLRRPRGGLEWLRGGLELYRDPYNGRYWICKAKTCDGCVVPWLYLDTLVHINGRATDQIQLQSNAPASSEWLRGEIEIYKDPRSESLWICPAQSSEGSGYPWIYLATLLQRGARAMGDSE